MVSNRIAVSRFDLVLFTMRW